MDSTVLSNEWTVGLYQCEYCSKTCKEDVLGCLTCCLPCVTFGRIAHIVDEGQSSCFAHSCVYGLLMTIQSQWVYSCIYRGKLRAKFGLPSEPCGDCCLHFWCEPCALCQEHAELNNRGFNPSKGCVAEEAATAPPMPPSMHK